MATLDDLIGVRSQRALRLRAHLEPLANGTAWPLAPWLRQAGHTQDAVYVEPDVVRWDRARTAETVDEELRAAMAPSGDDRARVRWADVWRDVRRAVILGRPGEGKTTLLQRTCRQVADSSLKLWDARTRPLDEIPVPIWMRAEDLMRAGSVTAALGIGAVGSAASAAAALSVEEQRAALASPLAWLFVDALDERPEGVTDAAAVAALATLRAVRARVVLSVRTYAWRETDLPFPIAPYEAERVAPGSRRDPSRGTDGEGVDPEAAPDAPAEALAVYELAPLTVEQRTEVVARWCASPRREQVTPLLDEAPLRELTSNALLLTLLCAAATADPSRRISRETRRVELYAWLVTDLVTRADRIALDPTSDAAQDRVLALARAAWALWQRHPGTAFPYQDWVEKLRAACKDWDLSDAIYQALKGEVERSGLLVREGAERRFFPLTAYEYLAGAGLGQDAAVTDEAPQKIPRTLEIARTLAAHAGDTTWREMSTLAIGHLAVIRKRSDLASRVVLAALDAPTSAPGAVAALLGEALIEAGERDPRVVALLRLARRETGEPTAHAGATAVFTDAARRGVIRGLLTTMRADETVPAPVRARAGAALGWVGDPRFDPEAYYLPVATEEDPYRGFIGIPAGRFTMGSDRTTDFQSTDWDGPAHEVRMERPFLLSRWPITVAQFGAYLQAAKEGPGHPAILAGMPEAPIRFFTAPVRFVTQVEAEQYCAWLTRELANHSGPLSILGRTLADWLGATRVVVRLPSEEEWEYVAKGGNDERVYPWGSEWDANKANSEETGVGAPSAVGCFRGGAARWGVEELSGNVWERTGSAWRDNYQPSTRPDASHGVVRGGAFRNGPGSLRSADRRTADPAHRISYYGFRVAVFPFRS